MDCLFTQKTHTHTGTARETCGHKAGALWRLEYFFAIMKPNSRILLSEILEANQISNFSTII